MLGSDYNYYYNLNQIMKGERVCIKGIRDSKKVGRINGLEMEWSQRIFGISIIY